MGPMNWFMVIMILLNVICILIRWPAKDLVWGSNWFAAMFCGFTLAVTYGN